MRIKYLGLILNKGKIERREHDLKALARFPDEILDFKALQIFLGCLNYIK